MSKSATAARVIHPATPKPGHRPWCHFRTDADEQCRGEFYCSRRVGWVASTEDDSYLTSRGAAMPTLVVKLQSYGPDASWVSVELRPAPYRDVGLSADAAHELVGTLKHARRLLAATETDVPTANARQSNLREFARS